MKLLWLLNPDAELELAHKAHRSPGHYMASRATREAMASRRAQFQLLTLSEPARILGTETDGESALEQLSGDVLGLLWCPTPSAITGAQRLGLRFPPAPDFDLLVRANDKTKLETWGLLGLPGRQVITSLDQALAQLGPTPTRFKRPFGFAGRGQRRLTQSLSTDDRRWLTNSLTQGALVAEPDIEGPRLMSLHFFTLGGYLLTGQPVEFSCDRFGSLSQFASSRPSFGVAQKLVAAALPAVQSLQGAGYEGPLSIDFVVTANEAVFALDLNVRFSLGFRIGLGDDFKNVCALSATAAQCGRTPS